ncbi:MAG TPA: tetratricopeptide repeat protein [Verrucomicrobiae bacterium]|nr:tetratricopeptide repeat protein [Verrucomicrobiae bacterium]
MWRALLIVVFAVTLAQSAHAQEDPRDVERQFRFLLARADELREEKDRLEEQSSPAPAAMARWNAHLKHLERDYQHFLHDHPTHARAMVAYGGLLYDEVDEQQGERWWEKAIAVDPREPYAYNDIANIYGHEGQAAKALRYYQTAIDLEPHEPVFRFNWATTCQLFRNESKAVYGWSVDEIFQHCLEQFRAARDLDPTNYDYASNYAETFYQMPKPDWAAAYEAWQFCLRQPLDDGQRAFVSGHLARVCIRLGRIDEARQWLSKLSGADQQSVRRAIERRIAEASPTPAASTATNPPPASATNPSEKR